MSRPQWLQDRVNQRESVHHAVVSEPIDIIDQRFIIENKPDIDVVREYFREEVEDLGVSDESSSD